MEGAGLLAPGDDLSLVGCGTSDDEKGVCLSPRMVLSTFCKVSYADSSSTVKEGCLATCTVEGVSSCCSITIILFTTW